MLRCDLGRGAAKWLRVEHDSRTRLVIFAIMAATIVSCPSVGLTAPRVTVTSLDAYKVALLPWTEPAFTRALKPGMAKDFDALLPFTAVIQNQSEHEIIAYSVLWNCIAPDGQVTTGARIVDTFSKLIKGANFQPHTSEVVALVPSLEAGATNVDAATVSHIAQLVAVFVGQTEIRISLDAVLFDDGSAVGLDHGGWIPRWKAWLDAEKEVLTAAVRASDTERPFVLRQFGTGEHDTGELAALANHADGYDECLGRARGYFALSLLKEIDEGSGEDAMKNVRNIVGSKSYPSVHRMGE